MHVSRRVLCVIRREWSFDGEGCGQVCWVARQPSQLPYHWSMLMFSATVKEKGEFYFQSSCNLSNPDTNGFSEVSLFVGGLKLYVSTTW